MTDSVHGHEVMGQMIESSETYTHDTLRTAIGDRFGQTARFHTCLEDGMTADALIAFLAACRKVYTEDAGFKVHEDEICDDA